MALATGVLLLDGLCSSPAGCRDDVHWFAGKVVRRSVTPRAEWWSAHSPRTFLMISSATFRGTSA
ncbi:hypothetical protein [Ornithinimicrobium kibberense]|uniref:hypothetical protein n=1 Tax=Ornithinimicrobium kibberense TaxID=282060 RepID=UPI003609CAD3